MKKYVNVIMVNVTLSMEHATATLAIMVTDAIKLVQEDIMVPNAAKSASAERNCPVTTLQENANVLQVTQDFSVTNHVLKAPLDKTVLKSVTVTKMPFAMLSTENAHVNQDITVGTVNKAAKQVFSG